MLGIKEETIFSMFLMIYLIKESKTLKKHPIKLKTLFEKSKAKKTKWLTISILTTNTMILNQDHLQMGSIKQRGDCILVKVWMMMNLMLDMSMI